MTNPIAYPYNPSRKLIALGSLPVAILTTVAEVGVYPRGPALIAGGLLGVLGGLQVLRRLAFPRELVLNDDGLWLPDGALRMHVRRVRYAEIDAVWEHEVIFRLTGLRLRVGRRTLDILASYLPDEASSREVHEILLARVPAMRPGPIGPDRSTPPVSRPDWRPGPGRDRFEGDQGAG